MELRILGVAVLVLAALSGCSSEDPRGSASSPSTSASLISRPEPNFCEELLTSAGIDGERWKLYHLSSFDEGPGPRSSEAFCDVRRRSLGAEWKQNAVIQVVVRTNEIDLAESEYDRNSKDPAWILTPDPSKENIDGWWDEGVRFIGAMTDTEIFIDGAVVEGVPMTSHAEEHWLHAPGLIVQVRLRGAYVPEAELAAYTEDLVTTAESLRDAIPDVLG